MGVCDRVLKIEVAHLPEFFVAKFDIVNAICVDH